MTDLENAFNVLKTAILKKSPKKQDILIEWLKKWSNLTILVK